MSRLLKSKKRIAACIFDLAALFFIGLILYISNIKIALIAVIEVVIIVVECLFLYTNLRIKKKILEQAEPFSITSKVRNVDCLIIGGECDPLSVLPKDCKNYVQLHAPGESLKSSFVLLEHTSSILKENSGSVVLVPDRKTWEKQQPTVFDSFFFPEITFKKYHVERLKRARSLPLLYSPNLAKLFTHNYSENIQKMQISSDSPIVQFCKEREMRLYLYSC